MTNRRYERTLIMLKPDTSGYSFDNKEPTGHSTIEIRSGKARLITYVQSLAPLKKHQVYRVYLIAADNSTALAVSCGAIPIGETAKAESRWEFDPDNVGGTGRAIEQFNIVAVLVRDISVGASGASKDIIAPLVGYVDTQRVWKNLFTIYEKETSPVQTNTIQTENHADCIQADADANADNENADADNENADADADIAAADVPDSCTEAAAIPDAIPDAINEADDNIDSIETLAVDSFETTVEESAIEEPDLEPADYPDYRFIKSYNVDSAAHSCNDKTQYSKESDLTLISHGNPEMNPFIDRDNDRRWVRISLPDLAALPIDFWKYGNNAFMLSCYKKYRHYILGTGSGVHVFGIPCVYSHGLRQHASKLGFTRFKCCSGSIPQDGEYGYWLMDVIE